ncbi:right-handed parallel beta-helix repeat-containing protein [Aestuariivivens sediminis]|uniref:right-handed parallel beta-helix repeat-containing protein n=1 Tax=Aestuariivivens sediminis TaxID=2913557 RepID=UPI001F59AD47|nr:right-handed parallel beta-helix repeat-containing protein [Aestuariivivens sediminis]
MKNSIFLILLISFNCLSQIQMDSIKVSVKAIIQYENGKYSDSMTTKEGFGKLKSNETLYLSSGRVELIEPLNLKGLQNIQIIGNNTSLVAKIDMPVITFLYTQNVVLKDVLIVHEIGSWCAQNCVEFYDASNIQIENCTFDGSGYFGLTLTKVQHAIIENNKFYNCHYGLAAWDSNNLIVKNNSFSNNRGQDIMASDSYQFTNDVKSENIFE